MRQVTIIGGGIAGLVCAALAQARGFSVTVIEAGPAVGGLWKSTDVDLGGHRLRLDAGLRLPVATGEDRLDRLLFHRPDFSFGWTSIEGWPREGAITAGRFNAETSCLDATVLGDDVGAVIGDMRAAKGNADGISSAIDHARQLYGPTLADGLIRDAVTGMFDRDITALDASAVRWFVPRRIVLGDSMTTARLMADVCLADRVAHARHADLPQGGGRQFLLPRDGGISTWVDALHESLKQAGVAFILNDGLRALEREKDIGAIRRIILRSGRMLAVDQTICTVAPAVLARAAGMETGPPPPFRHLHISHILVDRAPGHPVSYALNFRRDAAFFRAVFHDNLGDVAKGAHVVTFEHLVGDEAGTNLGAAALAQCVATGAMPQGTGIVAVHGDIYRNAIAVPTMAHGVASAAIRAALLAIPGLHFAGRSAGGAPFLDRIIHEADAVIGTIEQEQS